MNELYKYINSEIEYFFNEQEFMEREFLLVDVSDYQILDEDEIDIEKLMFRSEIEGVELEENVLKIIFNKCYLQDLREELLEEWNEQEIVKKTNWMYR